MTLRVSATACTRFSTTKPAANFPYCRAVTVLLNLQAHVATLVKSINQPEGQLAGYSGSAQTTKDGDLFVSWGSLPYVSEFSPSGKLLFNAELPSNVFTYRAYLLPWPPLLPERAAKEQRDRLLRRFQ